MDKRIPVEVSARHCHLSAHDLEKLFGIGYNLKKFKQLFEPSDFACEETVDILIGSKKFEKVRVVGPLRNQTQVEISATDAVGSGLTPPVRLSGSLEGSAPVTLVGPNGRVELKMGMIVARRHIHCATEEAKKMGLKSGQLVSVEIKGERALMFHCIEVRVKDDYKLCMHIDTDEGNAAGINKTGEGFLIMLKFKSK